MKDDRVYLLHMREAAERISRFTVGGREQFLTDPMRQDAVLRNFEVLGEAAKRVSGTTRERYPELPWRQVAGFRDVIIHQYEGVDLDQVWLRVENDLPELATRLDAILAELGST